LIDEHLVFEKMKVTFVFFFLLSSLAVISSELIPLKRTVLNSLNPRGLYFVTTSETDTTPLLLALQRDAATSGDVLNWYKWNQTSSQFTSVKTYKFQQNCNEYNLPGSNAYLLDHISSPNNHPLLFLGCSYGPLMIDLWTLDIKLFQTSDSYLPLFSKDFWYNKATPTIIWISNYVYKFGWDIKTLALVDTIKDTDCNMWCSDILSIGSSILISDESRLRQWDAANFIKDNKTVPAKFSAPVPDLQILSPMAVSATTKVVYAFGRQWVYRNNQCTGGYSFVVDDDKPVSFDKSLICLTNKSVADPVALASIVVDEKKTVVLISTGILSLLNLDLEVLYSDQIGLIDGYDVSYQSIIVVRILPRNCLDLIS